MVTLNLKFMRIPLLLFMFLLTVLTSVIMSLNPPSLRVGSSLSSFLISSGNGVRNDTLNIGFLSLVKNPVKAEANLVVMTPATSEKTSSVVSKTPAVPNTPQDISVSNATDYKLDIESYLSDTPSFLKESFSVLIVHTHTTESYTPSEKYSYTPSDTDRTLDKNYNMVRVGNEIKEILEKNGVKVHHDTTINDYPSYNGSYNRSSTNVQNTIKNDPSIKMVLDIHRDAMENSSGEKVKYNTTIDENSVASVMLVAGSNLSGLSHNNWEKNLNFAATLQAHIQGLYPGLMRPLNFRSQRFNQHLAPGAIIVEVGTNGNTLDEALLGAKYFAEGLADYIKTNG